LYLLGNNDAKEMDEGKIRSCFLYCAQELKITESQINSRYNAVKFYFEQVLGREKFFIDLPRPKMPSQLPKHISVQNVFSKAMDKAKINKDVGIHSLRHSYATHLLENGTDISYIQQLLGHNDIKTAMIWTRVAQKNLKKVKSPLDNL
jgi:site-specific recombinase XerD